MRIVNNNWRATYSHIGNSILIQHVDQNYKDQTEYALVIYNSAMDFNRYLSLSCYCADRFLITLTFDSWHLTHDFPLSVWILWKQIVCSLSELEYRLNWGRLFATHHDRIMGVWRNTRQKHIINVVIGLRIYWRENPNDIAN